jgi:palmitoyltransferase
MRRKNGWKFPWSFEFIVLHLLFYLSALLYYGFNQFVIGFVLQDVTYQLIVLWGLGIIIGLCLLFSLIPAIIIASKDPGHISSTDLEHADTTTCRKCQITVPKDSLHCKYCDKCIPRLDHHCFFLNTCIGITS